MIEIDSISEGINRFKTTGRVNVVRVYRSGNIVKRKWQWKEDDATTAIRWSDHVVRSATVKTNDGEYHKTIINIYLLQTTDQSAFKIHHSVKLKFTESLILLDSPEQFGDIFFTEAIIFMASCVMG